MTPDVLTPERLAELRAKHAAMTPGPWEDDDHGSHWSILGPNGHIADVRCYRSPGLERIAEADANARGIVALHNHFPALLDAAEERDRLHERAESLAAEWAVMARACDNWRTWAINPTDDHDHADWKVAARAILERDRLAAENATLRAELEIVNNLLDRESKSFGEAVELLELLIEPKQE